MQQWEYMNLWVTEGEREFETGEKGFLGAKMVEKRRGWWASVNGQELGVSQALSKLGMDGWELVSAVVGQDYFPDNITRSAGTNLTTGCTSSAL